MTESMFTIARQEHACPRCGARTGAPCVYPSGGRRRTPHVERTALLSKLDVARCVIATATKVVSGKKIRVAQ